MKTDLFDLTLTEFCFSAYSRRLTTALASTPLYRLAQTTGISRNTLKKYRNGESSPDLFRLNLIAAATQYSLMWLLFGSSTDNNQHQTSLTHKDNHETTTPS